MNLIIQQIIENALTKYQGFYTSSKALDICNNLEPLVQISNEIVLGLVKATVESLDQKILKDKKTRKELGLTVQQRKVKRTIALSMGVLDIERTCYFDQKNNAYVYPIDSIIGLEPRERVSKELSAELVNEAVTTSYQHSCDMFDTVSVSRQTVKNKTCELGEVVFESDSKQKKVEHLDIYADEDHVTIRTKAGKTKKIVPLVVVSEGKVKKGNRTELLNPIAFQGFNMKSVDFWEGISAVIRREYDTDILKTITIHSDAGKWIMSAKDVLLNAEFVMDEFHIDKRIKSICAGSIGKAYALKIKDALNNGNYEEFDAVTNAMIYDIPNYEKTLSDIQKRRKRLLEEINYFKNHWESIQKRLSRKETGSCTEAMVSHILAERLSRNPAYWSELGISKMAMLRVGKKNGIKVTSKDIGKGKSKITVMDSKGRRRRPAAMPMTRIEKYMEYYREEVAEIFNGKYDWSIFETHHNYSGNLPGTRELLKAINM